MKAVFCESHRKFELMVESVSEPMAIVNLNEQGAGLHHLARDNHAFCHTGPLKGCKLCQ